MNFTIVTAFFDIGRENWHISKRSVEQYFNAFEGYFHQPYKQILFLDDRHLDRINIMKKKYQNDTHLTIIPINEEWIKKNIWCWSLLNKETEIMQNDNFKALVVNRQTVPETVFPKYTLINHAKIDFICYCIDNNLIKDDLIAWSDFGCCKIESVPETLFDFSKIKLNKINFSLYNNIDKYDNDVIYTVLVAPPRMIGTFYIGPKNLYKSYQSLYHQILLKFQEMNLADDDQHIMLRCYFECPEMFELHDMKGSWPLFYNYFKKKQELNLVVVTNVIHAPHSIYTSEERIQQTIKTIQTIRQRGPNSFIVFLEGGTATNTEIDLFLKLVDQFIIINISGLDKSAGEFLMLYSYFSSNEFKNKFHKFTTISKLSGRYYLNDNFNFFKYKNIVAKFRLDERQLGVFETRYYRVPQDYFPIFMEKFTKIFQEKAFINGGMDIEHMFAKYEVFPIAESIQNEMIGISGNLAPDGMYIED